MARTNPVTKAVREKLDRLHGQLPLLQIDVEKATQAYELAKARVVEMRHEIDELGRFLEIPSEMDFAQASAEGRSMPETNATVRAANLQLLSRARSLLEVGKPLTTRAIYEGLLRQGQVFTAQNPVQRLSQILSASEWFVSDRVKGWSLKSEASVGLQSAEASGATKSEEDDEL